MNQVTLKIDNKKVTVPTGSTILQAARKVNIEIPTLCYLDGLEHFTSCMICVVHDINQDSLVPACSMPAAPGMNIETNSERARAARKDALDFLLAEHAGDCEAPCRRACPAGMDIPRMIRLIEEKNWAAAIAVVKRDIALPTVMGRVCHAPCEKACRRKDHDDPVGICLLKRFVADVDLAQAAPYTPQLKPKSGKKVAIAGAGPAGLAAAYYLLQQGHECFIYEREDRAGGGLRSEGLREKLPEAVLEREIEQIVKLGVHFYFNQTIGRDISLAELRDEYDALVLAPGTIEPGLFEGTGIELTKRGVRVDPQTYRTALPGIFAGGNAIAESRSAIRSLAHGKEIALTVDRFLALQPAAPPSPTPPSFLKDLPQTHEQRRFDSRLGKVQDDEMDEFLKEAQRYPHVTPAQGHLNGYSEDEAVKEAARCLGCDCRKADSCKLRCYAEEYEAGRDRFKIATRRKFQRIIQHDRVIYEPSKCIKCGLCVRISREAGEKYGLTFIDRGFSVRIEAPFNEPLSRALVKTAEACCAACPTGALSRRGSATPP